mmetsp:Transcript_14414/g.24822  ORF Transcript_14414/g.24822 Transcript_14414/m.24822 type:complete len:225 (-) Transcript_14414:1386-2060(-)
MLSAFLLGATRASTASKVVIRETAVPGARTDLNNLAFVIHFVSILTHGFFNSCNTSRISLPTGQLRFCLGRTLETRRGKAQLVEIGINDTCAKIFASASRLGSYCQAAVVQRRINTLRFLASFRSRDACGIVRRIHRGAVISGSNGWTCNADTTAGRLTSFGFRGGLFSNIGTITILIIIVVIHSVYIINIVLIASNRTGSIRGVKVKVQTFQILITGSGLRAA